MVVERSGARAASLLGRMAERAGIGRDALAISLLATQTATPRAISSASPAGSSMIVGGRGSRARSAAPTRRRWRGATSRSRTSCPRSAADRQARAPRDGARAGARERLVGRGELTREAVGDLRDRSGADRRGRRDGGADGARAARAGRAHDVRGQPARRPRACAGRALEGRVGSLDELPTGSWTPTSWWRRLLARPIVS